MWGTLLLAPMKRYLSRIIPTYVGNTGTVCFNCRPNQDHPYVCGEHQLVSILKGTGKGSSLRMWGTPLLSAHAHMIDGIIPTYVGNTWLNGCT